MSRASPFVVQLSEADRATLEQRARSYAAPHAQVIRQTNSAIAERLDVHVDVMSRSRKRFCMQRLEGLVDRPRSGRPRTFAATVKAMACEPPAQREVPLSRWSSAQLARQAAAEDLVVTVSASTVRRWLAQDAIRPWQYRSWIFPRDPEFAPKAARVLDLYARMRPPRRAAAPHRGRAAPGRVKGR